MNSYVAVTREHCIKLRINVLRQINWKAMLFKWNQQKNVNKPDWVNKWCSKRKRTFFLLEIKHKNKRKIITKFKIILQFWDFSFSKAKSKQREKWKELKAKMLVELLCYLFVYRSSSLFFFTFAILAVLSWRCINIRHWNA